MIYGEEEICPFLDHLIRLANQTACLEAGVNSKNLLIYRCALTIELNCGESGLIVCLNSQVAESSGQVMGKRQSLPDCRLQTSAMKTPQNSLPPHSEASS